MNPNFTSKERELIKLVNYFKRLAEKKGTQNTEVNDLTGLINACDTLVEKLEIVADRRAEVNENRKKLQTMIKDNASCPKCEKNTHLKSVGVSTDNAGLKFNSYNCRKCNIRFDWGRPNNPWDLLKFMKGYMDQYGQSAADDVTFKTLQENIAVLEPVLMAADADYNEMKNAETEMEKLVNSFTKQLMIEKIKMQD